MRPDRWTADASKEGSLQHLNGIAHNNLDRSSAFETTDRPLHAGLRRIETVIP
ncbi:MAG: hypothetical protein LC729_00715 [Acidobacteria bacterium]|nr:hypothetical protein [Acidobacteriota bacterium]